MRRGKLVPMAVAALLLATLFLAPGAGAQAQVTIDVVIDRATVDVNMSQPENLTFVLSGNVTVAKPPSKLIVVQVQLTISAPSNLTVDIDPATMAFSDPGTEPFTLTVSVPDSIKNVSEMTVRLDGRATTASLPTATDWDSVRLSFTYPPPVQPPPDPPDDDEPGVLPLTDIMMFCGVSLGAGALIAALLVLKKRMGRKRATQVVYVHRPQGPTRPG